MIEEPPESQTRPPGPMVDLTAYYLPALASLEPPLDWRALFGNDRPVELEVGPGKGLFLAGAAAAEPAHNFLGVELSNKYARLAAERVAKQALGNVRVMQGDARLLLTRFVPPGSVRVIHVYFPDPWWKKRHKKRRVFTAPFAHDLERALEPGGELSIASDVEEYFGVMRAVIAGRPRFVELTVPEPKQPEHDLDYLTNFERKYRIEGRTIHRARYKLAGPALVEPPG